MSKVYFCKQEKEGKICSESNPDKFPKGRYSICKECKRNHYNINRDIILERKKDYHQKNKETISEQKKQCEIFFEPSKLTEIWLGLFTDPKDIIQIGYEHAQEILKNHHW